MSEHESWRSIKSEALENYLKCIYRLNASGVEASVQEIAHRIVVSSPGVSKMLRHLAKHQLIDYRPYHPVKLTELGERVALEVIRHHRLLELYLTESLGYGWDQVHDEAERLEHHISEEFEDTIERMLGYPLFDPHGDPIPTRDGKMPVTPTATLESQADGVRLVVRRVSDEDSELLRYLGERGLRPGAAIELIDREPFGGSLHVLVMERHERISPTAARSVFVERAD
ncbi:MAG: metal-dependent transcriptional regulator [Capsulimonadaceae bacterium]